MCLFLLPAGGGGAETRRAELRVARPLLALRHRGRPSCSYSGLNIASPSSSSSSSHFPNPRAGARLPGLLVGAGLQTAAGEDPAQPRLLEPGATQRVRPQASARPDPAAAVHPAPVAAASSGLPFLQQHRPLRLSRWDWVHVESMRVKPI